MNAAINTATLPMTVGNADALDSREDPDRSLVENPRPGNIDAFEALVLRHQTQIVNYAAAVMRNSNDAEDVAQQTFLRAYRALTKFRGESTFKTWLTELQPMSPSRISTDAIERGGYRATASTTTHCRWEYLRSPLA